MLFDVCDCGWRRSAGLVAAWHLRPLAALFLEAEDRPGGCSLGGKVLAG